MYDEPELALDKVLVVRYGPVSFPLTGKIPTAELTAAEIEQEITRRLAQGYVKKASVTVLIDSCRLYFIEGEVKRLGRNASIEA